MNSHDLRRRSDLGPSGTLGPSAGSRSRYHLQIRGTVQQSSCVPLQQAHWSDHHHHHPHIPGRLRETAAKQPVGGQAWRGSGAGTQTRPSKKPEQEQTGWDRPVHVCEREGPGERDHTPAPGHGEQAHRRPTQLTLNAEETRPTRGFHVAATLERRHVL